ncbi:hypothetical protein [Eubacterium oxidoreducens]|uniref:DUF1430 domain-containing protein n=1 Tax=Eubacterium oxidoreducens TaxID=1732 RepID=A0A1G6CTM8_EUBOX|nr:hypothetical protein [Eubacterium oxidoreducens]SDB36164.1 hypothetical protein SAMN02910417_02670 [Eubacterium oxidoreducens]
MRSLHIIYLGVKDKNGNNLQLKGDGEYLLIPENLWEKRDEIEEYEEVEEATAICIPKGQRIMNLENPGKYSYNSVIWVTKLEKMASIGYGEVLVTENVAKQVEQKLLKMGYEEADVQMEPLSGELRTHIATYQVELFEKIIYFVVLLFAYILVDISLFVIYYEFKKKKMAVYSLLGKKTVRDILTFLIYNAAIVLVVSGVVNKTFMLVVIPETVIFYVILSKKSFESIGSVIKGR